MLSNICLRWRFSRT